MRRPIGEYSQREIKVPVMTLDSFDLRDVATIKIDVEGHEAQVLTGAIETLKREHPTLLVEIEDQRTPGAMGAVRRVLDPLGYQAMFLFEGQVLPLSDFNPSVHQRVDRAPKWGDPPSDRFVNTFMYSRRPAPDRPTASPWAPTSTQHLACSNGGRDVSTVVRRLQEDRLPSTHPVATLA